MWTELVRQDCLENALDCRQAVGIPKWKRVVDLCFFCFLTPGLVVLTFLIGCFIKLVSRGPIFFGQQRIGYLGRPFTCWKFRTMHVTADHSAHEQYACALIHSSNVPMKKLDLAGDPRVIRFGGILRASGLDELPQLLNVLLGEMSLVGPRPCMPYEYARYSPAQRRRCETLPGLTGLWQVRGKNNTTFDEMMALDLEYVDRRSLGLDLLIIAQTFPTLWSQIVELCQKKKNRLKRR